MTRLYLGAAINARQCEHGRRDGFDDSAKRAYTECPDCIPILRHVYRALVSEDPHDPCLETEAERREREARERERHRLVETAMREQAEAIVSQVVERVRRKVE